MTCRLSPQVKREREGKGNKTDKNITPVQDHYSPVVEDTDVTKALAASMSHSISSGSSVSALSFAE